MYCICADGGTLGKHETDKHPSYCSLPEKDDRGGERASISTTTTIANRRSSNPTTNHAASSSDVVMDRNMALRNARCRTPVVIDVLDDEDEEYENHYRRTTTHQHRPSSESNPPRDPRDSHEPPATAAACSYSSTTSSSLASSSMPPTNGGHFSRRRQSLVEALSNPVPSTRSNSPTSPAPIALLAPPRSTTSINILNSMTTNRPWSSVVSGSNENRDSDHRLFAIDELIRCERDYVSLLTALHEGFLKAACRHSDLFDTHLVRAIFGNLHQLRNLHEKLLYDLETAASKSPLCLGSCYLQHVCTRPTFEAYSHYCNNHQRSCRRLSQLYELESYRNFFEECRRACRLPTLRLDAFLLRPVQQLCRYPLLLATLLQRTPKTHHDYKAVSQALAAAQQLLTVVNNRRRLFEQLQELARWQKSVADWKGADLLQTSSRLVYNGDLVCTCYVVGDNVPRWRKRVFVFLFDRVLVLCRKDRLKKQLVFKCRFELDGTNKSCLLNGGAWQLTAPSEAKRLLFKASSKQEAKLWLEALNKERYLVQQTARLPTIDEKMLAIEMAKESDA